MQRLATLCLIGLVLATAAGSDWPTYKHSGSRNARTGDSLAGPVVERWSITAPQPPQLAWPGPGGKTIEELHLLHRVRFDDTFHTAIAGGRVYFGSSVDNHVYCVDAETGTIAWTFCTGGPVRVAPSVANGRVFVGSDDGFAYCLDAKDGGEIWKRRAGPRDERILARGRMASRWPVRTSVLVDSGVAYFGAGTFPHETVYLYAVDAAAGDIVWKNDAISQRNAGRNDLTPQGYLLASEELLFVPSGRTLPAAIDRATGQLVHKQRGGGKQVGGTDVVLAGDQIYTIGEHEILATDQKAGEILQKLPARQIVLDGEISYIASQGTIHAVDHAKYAQVHADRRLRGRLNRLEGELRGHEAVQLQQFIAAGKQNLKRLRDERQTLAKAGQQGGEADRALQQQIGELVTTQSAHLERLPEAASDFNSKLNEAYSLSGIKWRTKIPHEASLICLGNVVIAGGDGEFAALTKDEGTVLWRQAVEGTVRGLAFSDGSLVVSTTAGRVACYRVADPASSAAPVRHAFDTVVTDDVVGKDDWTAAYAEATEDILQASGIRRGFCLVVGSGDGRLAFELARRSDMKIYCVERDVDKVRQSRERFRKAGLYGTRILVDHADLSVLPHPNYFANLVVADTIRGGGPPEFDPKAIANHVKPVGGVVCLATRSDAADDSDAELESWLEETGLVAEGGAITRSDGCTLLTRAALPGADSWSHQYGNAAATSSTGDERVRDGLSVLWYGDPGPSHMLNRHVGAVGPVSTNGRLFIQGEKTVMAYDAYNGEFLWETSNSGAIRTGVFNNFEPGNLVASDDRVFNVIGSTCLEMDASNGFILRRYEVPNPNQEPDVEWGYLAYDDGILYGTGTRREAFPPEEPGRRGRPAKGYATDRIFAFDTQTGTQLWEYQGQSISHTAVAIGDGQVVFVDSSITAEEREALLQQDKSDLRNLTGEAREIAERRLKEFDVRLTVALEARTGRELWSRPVDVTDCSGVGTGAGQLTVMVHDGFVVLCGANANGHYWDQFLAGEFARRRLVVLSAETGDRVWAKDANYRHRPIIVGDQIIAEPWAFKLATGAPITRTHPITGEETPWMFIRPGHHCGAISATPSMLFFRSGFTAYYDLKADSGTHHFGGHRLGCWINTIPANGLLLIPEASAGCACLFSLTSTIAFEPRQDRQKWGVYTAHGESLPVKHLALNLGAPGDRRDARGKLWLSYPRPSSREGLDLPIRLEAEFAEGGRFVQRNAESFKVGTDEIAWVFASGGKGLSRCQLPLAAAGSAPQKYDVTLYFAVPSSRERAAASVWLQGEQRATDVQTSAAERTVTRTFPAIEVRESLQLEMRPIGGSTDSVDLPVLAGIEVSRVGS